MLNLSSIMIGSMQPDALAKFYESVFQRPADMLDGTWHGWKVGNGFLTVGEHSDAIGKSKDPIRIILNFDTTEVKSEFERIKSLGAGVIKEPYQPMPGEDIWIATLSDPDGNYFQLMTPWDGN